MESFGSLKKQITFSLASFVDLFVRNGAQHERTIAETLYGPSMFSRTVPMQKSMSHDTCDVNATSLYIAILKEAGHLLQRAVEYFQMGAVMKAAAIVVIGSLLQDALGQGISTSVVLCILLLYYCVL